MFLLGALPGAVAQGIMWGLMAIGVYISYKILDIADLSVDGTICTGGCVCVILLVNGVPAWICVVAAFFAGALAGIVTGLMHTALGIPAILSGILTQLMLYTINIVILGKSQYPLPYDVKTRVLLNASDKPGAIAVMVIIVAAVIILLWRFFYTEIGLTIKSTGDNPDMSSAQGVNVKLNRVLGLAISNGIVALAGALIAQYNGSVSIYDGRGAIVIGLAAIFIGLSISLKIKPNFIVSLIGVIGGGIIYYIIFSIVVSLGLNSEYLKMISALIVVVFLAIPYLKKEYFSKQKPLPIVADDMNNIGGDDNA